MLSCLVSTYLLLTISGIGFTYLLTGWHKQRMTLALAMAPLMSTALLTIISVFILAYSDTPILYLHNGFFLLSFISFALLLGVYVISAPPSLFIKIPFIFFCAVIFIAFACNNFQHGILYHYLNPDIAAYGNCSSWIAGGRSLKSLSGITIIELFASALRWGFPAVVATMSNVSGFSVYQLMFPIVLVIFACGAWTIALIYGEIFDFGNDSIEIAFIALAILLNGAILYFYLEGFYPSIIGLVYFNVVISFLLIKPKGRCAAISLSILSTVLLSSLITMYSELYVLCILTICGFLFFSLFKRDWKTIQRTLIFILALMSAFFLIFPLSFKIVYFTFANMGNVSNVGYAQPAWAAPSDVLGLTNIYSHSRSYLSAGGGPRYSQRSYLCAILTFVLSFWAVFEFRRWLKNVLILTLLVGITAIFIYNRHLDIQHRYSAYNYLYDKLIIDFAPTFIAFFFIGIFQQGRARLKTKIKILIFSGCILVSSSALLVDINTYRGSVDLNSVDEIKTKFDYFKYAIISNPRGFRQGKMKTKLRYVDRASETIISSYLDDVMFDQWDAGDVLRLPDMDPVLLLVKKSNLIDQSAIYKKYKSLIIFDTPSYFLLKTKDNVAQIKKGNVVENIEKLFVME